MLTIAANTPKQDTKDTAAAGNAAHSLGDAAGLATAVATATEPVAPASPAAVQPPNAGPATQETPVRDSGGDSLAAVAAAAVVLKSKEAADSRAAAELKKPNHVEPGGARGARGAGGGKRPAAVAKPRAPTQVKK